MVWSDLAHFGPEMFPYCSPIATATTTWCGADNWGNFGDFFEAKLGWPVTASNATLFTVGELWDTEGGAQPPQVRS